MERRSGPRAAVATVCGPRGALLGSRLPSALELAWTTAEHNPAIGWINATLNLAVESARSKPLILYFYPPQHGTPDAAMLPAAFVRAEAEGALTAGTLIGLSDESPSDQRRLAAAERTNHLLLSDPSRALSQALPSIPTVERHGRTHYAPFTLIAADGRVRATFRPPPVGPLTRHVGAVADFLTSFRTSGARRPR